VSAYTAYSLTEEIIHPICLKFSPLCKNIIGGFSSSTVKVWDVQRPGRQISDLIYSTRKSRGSVKGIVSAVEFATEDTFFAGTYSKAIALFDMRDKEHCMHIGSDTPEFGGVVQLKYIPDTHTLLSGHRTDSAVLGFDVRKPDTPVLELPRVVKTHQRFEFDLLSSKGQLFAGDHYGDLTVFDLKKDGEIIFNKNISAFPLVSVSVSPEGYLVTGSGRRTFPDMLDSDDDTCANPDRISSFVGFHRIDIAPP
jgi:WD40 repeat protein